MEGGLGSYTPRGPLRPKMPIVVQPDLKGDHTNARHNRLCIDPLYGIRGATLIKDGNLEMVPTTWTKTLPFTQSTRVAATKTCLRASSLNLFTGSDPVWCVLVPPNTRYSAVVMEGRGNHSYVPEEPFQPEILGKGCTRFHI